KVLSPDMAGPKNRKCSRWSGRYSSWNPRPSHSMHPTLWLWRSVTSIQIVSTRLSPLPYELSFPLFAAIHACRFFEFYFLPREFTRPVRTSMCTARFRRERGSDVQAAWRGHHNVADPAFTRG